LGHATGDRLLRETAAGCAGGVRGTDTVARTGGDEFTVLVAGINDAAEPPTIAETLLDAMRAPFLVDGRQLFVTASIGIAFYPEHGTSHQALLAHADVALQRAKERGRDTYEVYAHDGASPAARDCCWRVSCTTRSNAVRSGSPTSRSSISAPGGDRRGSARPLGRTPLWGARPRTSSCRVAEESGLVTQLDTYVLLTACRQAVRWNSGRRRPT
jgi:predicted signal transduction protein with EAL and GGDEF domain